MREYPPAAGGLIEAVEQGLPAELLDGAVEVEARLGETYLV